MATGKELLEWVMSEFGTAERPIVEAYLSELEAKAALVDDMNQDINTIWKNLDDVTPEYSARVILLVRSGITPGLSGIASGKWGTLSGFNVAAWCYAEEFNSALPKWVKWEP